MLKNEHIMTKLKIFFVFMFHCVGLYVDLDSFINPKANRQCQRCVYAA